MQQLPFWNVTIVYFVDSNRDSVTKTIKDPNVDEQREDPIEAMVEAMTEFYNERSNQGRVRVEIDAVDAMRHGDDSRGQRTVAEFDYAPLPDFRETGFRQMLEENLANT